MSFANVFIRVYLASAWDPGAGNQESLWLRSTLPSVDPATDSRSLEQVVAGSEPGLLSQGSLDCPPRLTSWGPRACVVRGLPHSAFPDEKLCRWRPGAPPVRSGMERPVAAGAPKGCLGAWLSVRMCGHSQGAVVRLDLQWASSRPAARRLWRACPQ